MVYVKKLGVMKAVNGILSNEYILRQTYATLDSTKNNCCVRYTDGEELRNNISFLRRWQHSSNYSLHYQGQATYAVAVLVPPALNLGTILCRLLFYGWRINSGTLMWLANDRCLGVTLEK